MSSRTVFFLPGLGFGAAAVGPVAAALGDRFRVVGIDLPGHDGAPDAADGSVGALVDAAVAAISAEADGGPWLLAAHSMGGKVAALLTSRVLSGRAPLFGLAGLVLLAPSPASPEPMSDDKRAELLSWVAEGPISAAHAREFVAQNVATPLPAEGEQDAVAQVQRMSPLAWRRWLTEGSREDVSAAVGSLDLPVVVLAGEDDDDLGSSAQPGLLADVYPRARFVALGDTGHLLPYERPAEVAAEIERLWDATVGVSPVVPAEWGRLIASPRTGAEERGLLATRALADDPADVPQALTPAQLATLRALATRLLPQSADRGIDLAARFDAQLAAGTGDGWRPAGLPDDASAARVALDAVASIWPSDEADQDALIGRIIAADGIPGSPWTAAQLQRWLEDVRTQLTHAWVSHPASLARLGYDGFATSGVGEPAGWSALGADERDPWEPADLGTERPA